MKALPLERITMWGLLIILVGIVVHAPLTVLIGSQMPSLATGVKAWKEVLLLVILVLQVIIMTRQGRWSDIRDDMIVRLVALYVAIHIILIPFSTSGLMAMTAGLLIDLRYVVALLVFMIQARLTPSFITKAVPAAVIGAAIVSGFALLQVFVLPADVLRHIGYGADTIQPYLTVDKNPDYVRINSTLRGPNPLGLYAGAALVVCLAYVTHAIRRHSLLSMPRLRIAAIVVIAVGSLVALFASYSRSALLATGIACIAYIVVTFRVEIVKYWKQVAGVSTVFVALIAAILTQSPEFVQNVILHDNPTTGARITSNQAHLDSLQHGMKQVAGEPFGSGVGSAGSASLFSSKPQIVENQYIMIAHEAGWLGLVAFVALFGALLYRLWIARTRYWLAFPLACVGVGIAIAGMLLPVWADDTVAIVWWGLAGAIIGYDHER